MMKELLSCGERMLNDVFIFVVVVIVIVDRCDVLNKLHEFDQI